MMDADEIDTCLDLPLPHQWPSPAGIEARGCLVTAAALRVPDHTGSTPLWRHRIGRLVKDAVRRGEDSPFAAPGLHRRSRRTREALYATHLPWDPHHVSAAPGIEAMRVHHVADDEEASAMASAGLPTALGGRATRVDVAGEPRSSSDEESGPGFGSGGFLFGRDGARRRMAAAREEESEALRATLHLFQAVDEVVALLHALAAANPRALGRVAGSLHLGNRMRGAEMSGGGAAQGQTGAGPREMGDGVEKGRGVSSAKRKRGGVPENVGLEHEARGVLQERVRDREETGIDVRSGGDAGVVGVNASGADGMGEGAADANAGAGKGRALLLRRLGERRGKQGAAAGVAGDSKRGAATLRAGADVADATKGAGVATEGPGVQGSAGDGRWHQAVDVGSGHMYYYNERLGITQWEEPAGAQVVPLAEGWRRWLAERWAWGSLEVPKHGGGENGDGEAQAARLPRPETSGLLCGEHARGSGVHVRFGSDGESDEGENGNVDATASWAEDMVRALQDRWVPNAGELPPMGRAAKHRVVRLAKRAWRLLTRAGLAQGHCDGDVHLDPSSQGDEDTGLSAEGGGEAAIGEADGSSDGEGSGRGGSGRDAVVAVASLAGAALALADHLPAAACHVAPLLAWLRDAASQADESGSGADACAPRAPPVAGPLVCQCVRHWSHLDWVTPVRECIPSHLGKYFFQRYRYFSLYDLGCAVDEEGWFSVTPEAVAQQQALRCAGAATVVDAFCGVGGNTVHLARRCGEVVAVDLNASRLALARHNAALYGVEDRVRFCHGDFLELAKTSLAADVVFLSPPWGGPEYVKSEVFGVAKDIGGLGVGLAGLLALALWVVDRGGPRAAPRMWGVAVFLPRNASLVEIADEVGALRRQGLLAEDRHEVEECWVNGKLVAVTVYVGRIAAAQG